MTATTNVVYAPVPRRNSINHGPLNRQASCGAVPRGPVMRSDSSSGLALVSLVGADTPPPTHQMASRRSRQRYYFEDRSSSSSSSSGKAAETAQRERICRRPSAIITPGRGVALESRRTASSITARARAREKQRSHSLPLAPVTRLYVDWPTCSARRKSIQPRNIAVRTS